MIKRVQANRIFLLFIANLSLLIPAIAAENVSTGRYSELTTTATRAQLWPLSTVITIQFKNQTTVAQAINQALDRAGYQLHPYVWGDASLVRLLNLSIPDVHDSFVQMAIQEIVHALVGSSLDILVDPVTRYISFEPSNQLVNHDV